MGIRESQALRRHLESGKSVRLTLSTMCGNCLAKTSPSVNLRPKQGLKRDSSSRDSSLVRGSRTMDLTRGNRASWPSHCR